MIESLIKKPKFGSVPKPKISQVFLGADMRCAHEGLSIVAKKYHIDTETLPDNHMLVFINSKRTIMKVFVAGNILAHVKRDNISLAAICEIPRAFSYKGTVDYDEALRISLEKHINGNDGNGIRVRAKDGERLSSGRV